MIGFWDRLSPVKRPDPLEQQRALDGAQRQYDEVAGRDPVITNMSNWLDQRRAHNHFGSDLDISFIRKGRHA